MLNVTLGLLAQVWVVVPEGRTTDEATFTRVSDVTVRGQTFYVLDHYQRKLLVYTLRGEQVGLFGRRGEGPGDFSQAHRLGWVGDTLWVMDYPNRVHYLSPSGKFYRTDRIAGVGAYGPTAAGGVMVPERKALPGGPEGYGVMQTVILKHHGPEGATQVAATLNFFVSQLRIKTRIDGRSGTTYREEPFRDDPIFTMDREGQFLWVVLRRTSNEGPHEFRLVKLTTTGDTVLSRSYPYRPRRLDKMVVENKLDEVQQAILIQSPAHRTVIMRDELAKELYRPFHMPAVEQALVGRDGTIWLRRESIPGGKSIYVALSPRGDQIGTLHLPLAEKLIEADGQRLWTVTEDEEGVPSVAWYRVRR